MGLKEIQIVFDNQWSTYYAGQRVTGRVLINLDAPKKIRGIVIKLKGEANVSFLKSVTERDADGKSRETYQTFTAHESYFENKYNLVGSANGEMMMPAGEACYPFQTVLPHNLPSSFEGPHGHVRYTVKVTIDRPWKFDQESKAAYTVISPLDLNLQMTGREPVQVTQAKYFCCCCCRSGPLTLVVSLPHTGYVSGQKIPVTVEVDNISQQTISDVTCTLRKHMSFHARYPHHEMEQVAVKIASISFGSVGKNGSATWAKLFDVPPLPPSNLANCSIIDLSYDLKVEGKVSAMCHGDAQLTIPIVLGTIPLQEFAPPPIPGMLPAPGMPMTPGFQPVSGMPMAPGFQPPPGMPMGQGFQPVPGFHAVPGMPTAPEFPATPGMPGFPPSPGMAKEAGFQPPPGQQGWAVPPMTDPPPQYPGYSHGGMDLYPAMPPPSFAEATGGGGNMHEEGDSEFMQGDKQFVPRYPVYNYNPTAPPLE